MNKLTQEELMLYEAKGDAEVTVYSIIGNIRSIYIYYSDQNGTTNK